MKVGRFVGDAACRLPVIGHLVVKGREWLRSRKVIGAAKRLKHAGLRGRRSAWFGGAGGIPAEDWLAARVPASSPMNVFPVKDAGPRLTVVTDSVGPASLFGGVGTSLILGVLLARRMQGRLRLVTRIERPDAGAVREVLNANNLAIDVPIETAFVPTQGRSGLGVCGRDFFLATSWWSARALLATVGKARMCYLLQEDERMFYPYGDARLACGQTLAEPDVFTVINTQLLYQHLVTGPEALPNLEQRSVWFEPAFPGSKSSQAASETRKRRLFFYARPNNPRNLFDTGLAALANAIRAGLFPASEWELHFVGKDIPNVIMPKGVRPTIHQGLSWNEYQSFIKTMDAGFVLMDTPHPSYPPLDLAACGAAVLTTIHGIKTDLSRYSKNILMASPTPLALAAGLERLMHLAEDESTRASRRHEDSICRDWEMALRPVLDRIDHRFSEAQKVRAAA